MDMNGDCSQVKLNWDEACVNLKNALEIPDLWLYTLSSICVLCPYERITRINETETGSVKIFTGAPYTWRIIQSSKSEKYVLDSHKEGLYCQFEPNIGEHGIYEFDLGSNSVCSFRTIKEPQNEYIPLAVAFGLIILLLSCLSILKLVMKNRNSQNISENEEGIKNFGTKRRLRSIDTVRGMSIAFMIFSNVSAGKYELLFRHAIWDGIIIGDIMFPTFLFIMGMCIPLSISSQLSRGTSRLALSRAILKRSLYLFVIGICVNSAGGRIQFEKLRILGVLQRFSFTYLVAAISYVIFSEPSSEKEPQKKNLFMDIQILLPQWTVGFFILTCHSAITFFWPVPGCPSGYLGPGGLHAGAKYFNCSGGAAGYLDKVLIGVNHFYDDPVTDKVYKNGPFEPEGILSTLPAIFHVILGIQMGQILREYKEHKSRVLRWLVWAIVLGLAGSELHFSNIIPVNKTLWSISFVLVMTSISLIVLIICYLLIDVFLVWEGGPFRIPGMNSLVIFVGHEVLNYSLPFRWKYGEMNTHAWHLAENLWVILIWTVIGYILHHKKTYITI